MQKGKIQLVRDDEHYKVKNRLFKKPNDKTLYVAQVSLYKHKTSWVQPHKKEFWLGYYTPIGEQRGLGFFKNKKEVPKGFKAAFAGLDIKKQRKRR